MQTMQRNEQLRKELLDPVTSFFRDPAQFALLKRTVLPEMIARAREHDRTVRLWTVGCGTGEEAYSLAMLIADLLDPELAEWSIKLFATDREQGVLSIARRGWYPETLLTDLPPGYRDRFFERMEHGYRVSKSLRQLVIFGQYDPGRDAPIPRIDLILCRNVLSLLSIEVQKRILNQWTFSLFPAGYLVLGNAEQVPLPQAYYLSESLEGNIARCIGRAFPVGPSPMSAASRQTPLPVQERTTQPSEQPTPLPTLAAGQTQPVYERLLRSLPIGLVVLDRTYRVLTANSIARQLLGMGTAPTEQDFFHSSRGVPYHVVRNAIDSAFRGRNTLSLPEVEIDLSWAGGQRFVALTISPFSSQTPLPELAVMSLTDITEQVQMRHHLEDLQVEQVRLVSELEAVHEHVREVQKERLEAEQALQTANKEAALTQQKLQAYIEQLETTNQDLQTALEEWEVTKEQLVATNEELRATLAELGISKQAGKEPPGEAEQ